MAIDSDTTNKVLEALSINMKESSMQKEISILDGQIQKLIIERDKLETAKNQYLKAQDGAVRAATMAKDMANEAKKRIDEALKIAEKAIQASKEADSFAAMTRRPHNFDTPIQDSTNAINQADTAKKELNKNLNEVKIRKEELKKEGININLDGTRKPTSISV